MNLESYFVHSEQYELTAALELPHWWFRARRRILHAIIDELLSGLEAAVVMDIGCGTGANIAALDDRYARIGVDISADAIQLARRRFSNCTFYCGEAWHLPTTELEAADLFMLTDVLEHVEDDVDFLANLLARAKPGAYCLITVPADLSLWSGHDVAHQHFRRYDRTALQTLWDELPVTPVMVSYFNSRLYPLIKSVRGVNRWRGRAFGEAGTDLVLPPRWLNWLLERIFASEQRRLLALLRNTRIRGFSRGVSLVAVLRREAGVIVPHSRNGAAEQAGDEPRSASMIKAQQE